MSHFKVKTFEALITNNNFKKLLNTRLCVCVVKELHKISAHLVLLDVGGSVHHFEPFKHDTLHPLPFENRKLNIIFIQIQC